MGYTVVQRVITSNDWAYSYLDRFARKAKLLYNAALFRIRNIFTGYDKDHRTENETEVFAEVQLLQGSYPGKTGPESDHILSAGKAAACDREPGFLFRAAHADGTGCCKVCGVRFQELAVCPEGVPKASGKVSWEAKDAEV